MRRKRKAAAARRRSFAGMAVLVTATGSCATLTPSDDLSSAPVQIPIPDSAAIDPAAPPLLSGDPALKANAALPLAGPGGAAAPTLILASAAPVAQMRALDCLAQAIYYEARSESEDGQRAVAQVVLNRVRHPAWPNSVCGVVYQGPMRPGGGCQFTFTCDGSLAYRPHGENWARARRLAADALAGRVFEPVGLSTFYHANYVMPRWAPRLLKTAVIGAHLFYRLPGSSGTPGAFSARYAGVEPVARPNPVTVHYARGSAPTAAAIWSGIPAVAAEAHQDAAPAAPAIVAAPIVVEPVAIENLQVRPEYRQSGQWRSDAPASLAGR